MIAMAATRCTTLLSITNSTETGSNKATARQPRETFPLGSPFFPSHRLEQIDRATGCAAMSREDFFRVRTSDIVSPVFEEACHRGLQFRRIVDFDRAVSLD